MYEISKIFTFEASHQLAGLPVGHQCARLHGHSFRVQVNIKDTHVDTVGFIYDYGKMKPMQEWIDKELDHRHLNDVVDFNPTAENMCRFIYNKCKYEFNWQVDRVGWSETQKTWAWYYE